ncbi:hypothetical protein BS78_02G247000 [Paspalum vaginatum]|nr:hypothetical protein BS78_02G247000 [Paspalum vaginatum]
MGYFAFSASSPTTARKVTAHAASTQSARRPFPTLPAMAAGEGSSCGVAWAAILAASPTFGAAKQIGWWTSSGSGGRLRRAGVPVMGALDRRRRSLVPIFLCSRVLVPKFRGCICGRTHLSG